jgi:phosphoribosylglycinamide formyltransferase-1
MTAEQPPLPLYIVISGRGSNMLAIAAACAQRQINASVVHVVADRDSAPGIAAARTQGLSAGVIPYRSFPGREAFEAALAADIDRRGTPLIVLAGFMRILTPAFTRRYPGRMLNIHPSLLPAYPGLHTHQRAIAAGDRWHGVTVHYVTEELDGGPLLRQVRVPVLPGDTADTLSARVHTEEHMIYPEVIGWIAAGRLQWHAGGPWLDGKPLQSPIVSGAGLEAAS